MSLAARLVDAGYDWIVPQWSAPAGVDAFATTRNGGAGRGANGSLDLGPADVEKLDAETRESVLENRRRVLAFLPSAPIWLAQTHGNDVAMIEANVLSAARSRPPIADAAVTRLGDVPLAVRVADCLPVLFTDEPGSVVAVAHAGWRGLSAGVLEATIAAMRSDPRSLIAWIGPGIGPRAFEVGADVRDAFVGTDRGAVVHFASHGANKWLADLAALAERRLAAAGVRRITRSPHCTYSEPERFFSFRRDRTTGRQAAFIWRASRAS